MLTLQQGKKEYLILFNIIWSLVKEIYLYILVSEILDAIFVAHILQENLDSCT